MAGWSAQRARGYLLHSRSVSYGKQPRQTLVFLHGIGNSGEAWREVVEGLQESNVRVVVIDLLGFGKSPQPRHAKYDVMTQAKSVRRTLLLRGLLWRDIKLVGHSMGSLVAIEYARRYPAHVSSLTLCSPPLYAPLGTKGRLLSGDDMLRKLYAAIQSSPKQFLRLSEVAMKYELINASFNVTDKNITSYMGALRAAIINQTSLDDIAMLTLPIHIIRGTLDPVLIPKNLKRLARTHHNVTVSSITAGHEVVGRFAKRVADTLRAELV